MAESILHHIVRFVEMTHTTFPFQLVLQAKLLHRYYLQGPSRVLYGRPGDEGARSASNEQGKYFLSFTRRLEELYTYLPSL